MDRWREESSVVNLAEMLEDANNEAFALNLIEEPRDFSSCTLKMHKQHQLIPPPPSDIPPLNARRVSSRSELPEPKLWMDDGDTSSEHASTEGEAVTDPFELHVLERLALTKMRGTLSPNPKTSPSRKPSKCLITSYEDRFSNQVPRYFHPSPTREPQIESLLEVECKMKQRLTQMRAQMKLSLTKLQLENADLLAALTQSKDTQIKREKQLKTEFTAKLAAKDRQIMQQKKTIAGLNATIKSNQAIHENNERYKTEIADLKFEMKMMHDAYTRERETWKNSLCRS
ncbi:hypothetical protein AC1031_000268 [Aphanomyces cochlioides]|nr:hypothetical protein AC1031_000268 [Aphanomyces cochlioides]